MILNQLDQAADLLMQGHIVAIPTETVYGLAGHGYRGNALQQIYAFKGRPSYNPLIFHYPHLRATEEDVVWTPLARKLAEAFWPGPLTLVLEQSSSCRVAKEGLAGLSSIAIRVPRHPMALGLLEKCVMPLAAPSANPSGRLSPTTVAHVRKFFQGPILDGGPCGFGVESTIVDGRNFPYILRPGAISLEAIEQTLQAPLPSFVPDKLLAPGGLSSHYAPSKPLRLNAQDLHPGEGLLAFGPPLAGGLAERAWCQQLSLEENLLEAARHLFSALHALDEGPCQRIAAMPIPFEGLGLAINDRLLRAALGSCEREKRC